MSSEIKEKIVNFLLEDDALSDVQIANETELLRSGIIDSLRILEMVNFIEKNFSINFGHEDMIEDNLNSVNNIANFIEKKRAALS